MAKHVDLKILGEGIAIRWEPTIGQNALVDAIQIVGIATVHLTYILLLLSNVAPIIHPDSNSSFPPANCGMHAVLLGEHHAESWMLFK